MKRCTHTQRLPLFALVVAAAALLVGAFDGGSASGAYPGGNGRIAYETAVEGNFEIFVMNADGSGQTNVSNDPTPGGNNRDPIWSPDGTKIAFSRASEGHMNIWVMNADGSGQVNLTPGPVTTGEANDGVEPSWSPEGTRIAFNSGGNVWVMNASGSAKTNLTGSHGTAGGAFGNTPAWSPDGAKIAYGRQSDIWLMNADGSGPTQLTTSTRGEFRPDWSPDGIKIAYDRDGQIWVMKADGGSQTQLTGDAVGETGTEPSWSPDGTKIVFSSSGNGAPNGPDIFVMNADGTSITRLDTPVPASDLGPSWQPVAPPPPPPPPPSVVAAAVADLHLSPTVDPKQILPGDKVTYIFVVRNGGPNAASNVVLSIGLGSALKFVSVAPTGCSGSGPVSCALRDLANGQSTTVRLVVRAGASGSLTSSASARSDLSDPNGANNSASVSLAFVPPPVPGKKVNAEPVSGTVLVDGKPLTSPGQVRVGAVIDTRHGEVRLITKNGDANFHDGVFQLRQKPSKKAVTELVLRGGNFAGCKSVRKASLETALKARKPVRKLWGNGKGRFRTRARYSSATVRGTHWLTADRCDGTLTTVRDGSVLVRDFVLKKDVVVPAGRSYLAKPKVKPARRARVRR